MKLLQNIYLKILNSYPIPPPEQGGIMGVKNSIICEYFHDNSKNTTDRAVYEPDINAINQRIEEWDKNGIQFVGIVHSHLLGQNTLSSGDKEYIKMLFNYLPECIKELYFPIIIPQAKQVISFVAKRSEKDVIIQQDEIHIIQ